MQQHYTAVSPFFFENVRLQLLQTLVPTTRAPFPPGLQTNKNEPRTSSVVRFQDVESFVREVALGFMPSFLPLAERRGREPFTEKQRQWQLMRRGRYLEFNLLYDRGQFRIGRSWVFQAVCCLVVSLFLPPAWGGRAAPFVRSFILFTSCPFGSHVYFGGLETSIFGMELPLPFVVPRGSAFTVGPV